MGEKEDKAVDVEKIAEENKQLKAKIADLQKQIEVLRMPANQSTIKGFYLAVNDPFGMGAVRAYRTAGGKSNQPDMLPFVLPEKDEASKVALESYIVRASAGNDTDRVAEARKVLPAKIKPR